MSKAMDELSALIMKEILEHGPMRFDRFMELALYHPEFGYYRRDRKQPRTGREGDFFTSVSVGPLFGRLLAKQFLEMWEKLEKPPRFWIVEQGGEDAQLACNILGWCKVEAAQFYQAIRYGFVESNEGLRHSQREKLRGADVSEKVVWFREITEWAVEYPTGVFFSNELVDAFPVHIVTRKAGAWQERYVAVADDNRFLWTEEPIQDRKLVDAIDALQLPLLEGYTTEINLRARGWMKSIGRCLEKGYVLTIDYGFSAAIYYSRLRARGTLSAYRDHQRVDDLLGEPGSCDLTTHVDFTALERAGARSGLTTLGFLDQQHFLMGIAEAELASGAAAPTGVAHSLRAWNTLTHPGYLGSRFQVLIQGKYVPKDLAGLRYARPDVSVPPAE